MEAIRGQRIQQAEGDFRTGYGGSQFCLLGSVCDSTGLVSHGGNTCVIEVSWRLKTKVGKQVEVPPHPHEAAARPFFFSALRPNRAKFTYSRVAEGDVSSGQFPCPPTSGRRWEDYQGQLSDGYLPKSPHALLQ